MNEEQAEKLLDVLCRIETAILANRPVTNIEAFEKLKKFKQAIISNEFFNTLTEEQKGIVLRIRQK